MKFSKLKKNKFIKAFLKIIPQWSKNTAFIVLGVFLGIGGVAIFNPGHIVQKSLNLIGIDTDSEQTPLSGQTNQADQITTNESIDTKTSSADDAEKTDGSQPNNSSQQSQPKPTSRDSGSTSIITPEEYQAHADNGETKLIAKQDWDVKINSRSPSSCGTSSNSCPQSEKAKVNVSAYNVHTGELLPMTECNGTVNKPYSFSEATTTVLIDSYHCEISYQPTSSGMYRLQIELYLSTKVYTDTIYWGGWVWGTDSPTSDGYFVN